MCVGLEVRLGIRQLRSQLGPLLAKREQLPAGTTAGPLDALLILMRGERGYIGASARWGLVGGFLDRVPARPPLVLDSTGLADMPFYGRLLKSRRALLPVSALFVEQRQGGGPPRKFRVARTDGRALLLAVIHDSHPLAGTTCALLAAATPAALPGIVCRMPLVVADEGRDAWLDEAPDRPADELVGLLGAGTLPLAVGEIHEPPSSPQLAFAFA